VSKAILSAMLVTILGAAGQAFAQGNCLPRAALKAPDEYYGPALELGLVGGSVTLCARTKPDAPRGAACWTVNPATGVLTASAATSLPGRSQRVAADAGGCIAEYCPTPRAEAGDTLLWASSTNGNRVVVLGRGGAQVFDATSKALLHTISLNGGDEDVPRHTIVTNAAIRLLYLDDTIHVVGHDAGPFAAVWSFKDSGARLGQVTVSGQPDTDPIDVYRGSVSVIDGGHLAVADTALRRLVILDAAGKRTTIVRQVSHAPCTEENLGEAFHTDDTRRMSAACGQIIATQFAPYYDVELVRLPSGAFLAALTGKHVGEIAILGKSTLREVKRLKLARCAR
jgi:hypothetical protein